MNGDAITADANSADVKEQTHDEYQYLNLLRGYLEKWKAQKRQDWNRDAVCVWPTVQIFSRRWDNATAHHQTSILAWSG
ncbi:hypothetical protein MTO96_019516 [Rhipicephalus appendiculatus]